jgi:type IV pilus assembly protein PilO
MNLKDMPWQQQLVVFIIFWTVLFGLFYFAYYKPTKAEIARMEEEYDKLQQEIMRAKVKAKVLDKLIKESQQLEEKLKTLQKVLPERKEISQILKQVQKLASDVHLNIVKFIPKGETRKQLVIEWPIDIEVTGTYHNLGYFFDRLGKFTRIFNVNSIKITALADQTEGSTIKASFTAATYIFAEEKLTPTKKKRRRPRRRRPAREEVF